MDTLRSDESTGFADEGGLEGMRIAVVFETIARPMATTVVRCISVPGAGIPNNDESKSSCYMPSRIYIFEYNCYSHVEDKSARRAATRSLQSIQLDIDGRTPACGHQVDMLVVYTDETSDRNLARACDPGYSGATRGWYEDSPCVLAIFYVSIAKA